MYPDKSKQTASTQTHLEEPVKQQQQHATQDAPDDDPLECATNRVASKQVNKQRKNNELAEKHTAEGRTNKQERRVA